MIWNHSEVNERGVVLRRTQRRHSGRDELFIPQLEAAEVLAHAFELDVGDSEEGFVASDGQREVDGQGSGCYYGGNVEIVAGLLADCQAKVATGSLHMERRLGVGLQNRSSWRIIIVHVGN